MNQQINNNLFKQITIYFSLLFCFGCSSPSPNSAVIDRQFLYDIQKAFVRENKTGKDMSEVYNYLWKNNYYELIYLTTIGDEKAVDISISLIGQEAHPAYLFDEVELLVNSTFEDDQNFWKFVENKKPDVQCRVLKIFDYYEPIDWDIVSYVNKHPKIKKLYTDKYGIIEIEE
jgi:hypothetical protein